MKLSKSQIKAHKEAEALLEKEHLYYEDVEFIANNWYPAYGNQIGEIASYFTPFGLAADFCLEISGKRIMDLCAGIGLLGYHYVHTTKQWEGVDVEMVCIERNPKFVEVGKKILPQATWICADVLDESIYKDLGRFDFAISNPPFGKIKSDTNSKWLAYKGSVFEYKVIEIANRLADDCAFIIPQMSAPFKYSGQREFQVQLNDKYLKFTKETGIILNPSIGIDCEYHIDDWKGAAPKVEIVTIKGYEPDRSDYTITKTASKEIEEAPATIQPPERLQEPTTQQTLF